MVAIAVRERDDEIWDFCDEEGDNSKLENMSSRSGREPRVPDTLEEFEPMAEAPRPTTGRRRPPGARPGVVVGRSLAAPINDLRYIVYRFCKSQLSPTRHEGGGKYRETLQRQID